MHSSSSIVRLVLLYFLTESLLILLSSTRVQREGLHQMTLDEKHNVT
jgi:hypothetical protein